MHDLLLEHQEALRPDELIGYAEQLGLDVERFTNDLRDHVGAARVADDVDSADLSNVSGTPTFFINGRRHYGAYDIATPFGGCARGGRAGDAGDGVTGAELWKSLSLLPRLPSSSPGSGSSCVCSRGAGSPGVWRRSPGASAG